MPVSLSYARITGNTSEVFVVDHGDELPLIQDSLLRRMRTMFSLYHDAVETMELHHVNHVDDNDSSYSIS